MRAKRMRLTIGKSYVDVDIQFEDDELNGMDDETLSECAMMAAFDAGALEVEITDIDCVDIPNGTTH